MADMMAYHKKTKYIFTLQRDDSISGVDKIFAKKERTK